MLEIELFNHLIKCVMFNWIICDTLQYLELFNFVDFYETELLEMFDNLTVCIYKMCL